MQHNPYHWLFTTSVRQSGHVLKDLDLGMVRAVGVTLANLPEAEVTEPIAIDLQYQRVKLKELQIDRAYLTSTTRRK